MNKLSGDLLSSGLTIVRLDGEGGADEIGVGEIEQAESSGDLLWLHVNFAEVKAVEWLRHEGKIDNVIFNAMVDDDSRPRSLVTHNGALTILRGINMNPGADAEDMISTRIWVEKNRVITTSRRRLKSLEDIHAALNAKSGPTSPSELLVDIVTRLEFYIGEYIEQIEERLESVESDIADSDIIVKNSPFSALRRQTARIRRYLSPQREALERISRDTEAFFSPAQISTLREHVNHFTLLLEDLDLIRERAIVAHEEFLGSLAHEQNNRMFVLSIVAAIFLPLSFLTGLMGMNVAGLPGTVNNWSFGVIVFLMLVIAVLIMVLFKMKKWF